MASDQELLSGLWPVSSLLTSGLEDCTELYVLAASARQFLAAHSRWFPEVGQGWLYRGFAHLAVFLFEVKPDHGADPYVWVVVGDVPPAFIDISCRTGLEAIESYVFCMREWAEAVKEGRPVDGLIPVYYRDSTKQIPPDRQFADELNSRLGMIEHEVMPAWAAADEEGTGRPPA